MGRPKKTVIAPCAAEGCERAARSRGLCNRHYLMALRRSRSAKLEVDPSVWPVDALNRVAGMLEMRGQFRAKVTSRGRSCFVRLQAIDASTLHRARRLLSIGTVGGPYRRMSKRYPQFWEWTIARQQHVRALCLAIRPLMSERCQERIDAILDALPVPELVPPLASQPADPES